MIGFFWDILDSMIYSVFLLTCESDDQCPILMRANKLSFWYNTDLSGIWTLALTINRLTAIIWWQKYDEIWLKYFKYCFGFLSIYPFLLHGYSFFDYKCRLELELSKGVLCEEYWLEDAKVTSISSIIVAVISFFTDMITVTIYRIKIKKDNSLKKNPDKKLIYQAIISSFLFVLYTAIFQYWAILRDALSATNKIGVIYTIAYGGMHYSYIAFHGSAFILIFFISPNLRKHLLKFYHLTWIYKYFPSTKRLFHITTTAAATTTKSVSTANTLTPVSHS
uniref:Serpentine receptor class gamma n=1 Tax=Panagrolaimus sp. PS1159 TaxID=55785 RepID=A0AC35FU67_9BILA